MSVSLARRSLRCLLFAGAALACFAGTAALAAPLAADHTILYYLIELERHSTASCDGSAVPRDTSLVPSAELRETAVSLSRRDAEPSVLSRDLPEGTFVAMDLAGTPKQVLATLKVAYCPSLMNPGLLYIGAAEYNGAWVLLMSSSRPAAKGMEEPALRDAPEHGAVPREAAGSFLTPGEERAAAMMSTPGAASKNGALPQDGGRRVPADGASVLLPGDEALPPVAASSEGAAHPSLGVSSGEASGGAVSSPDIPPSDRSATESLPADSPDSFVGNAKEEVYLLDLPLRGGPPRFGSAVPSPSSGETPPASEPTPQYMRERPGITPLRDTAPPRPVELLPTDRLAPPGAQGGFVSPESSPLPDIGHKTPFPGDGGPDSRNGMPVRP